MQKVYLLLRNNQQTGPYSFEDLLHLQLKPFDLIWVEGKSYGWRYPTEVETLKNYFISPGDIPKEESINPAAEPVFASTVSKALPRKIFVSMPATGNPTVLPVTSTDTIEQKAEELRKRAQAYIPKQETVKTNFARDLYEAEEDYTQWIFRKKTKKNFPVYRRSLVIAAVSIGLLFAGWWVYTQYINAHPVAATTNMISPKEDKNENSIPEEPTLTDIIPGTKNQPASPAEINKNEKRKKEVNNNTTIASSQVSIPEPFEKKETLKETKEEIMEGPVTEEQKKEVTTEASVEKKKTLKEKINELFKKKNTGEVTEEERVSTDNNNNERKATRREEASGSTFELTDISNEVEIKTNKIADSWMMGVKNLKLTLYNRSELIVSSAKVEVQYYSDNNELLETKTLSFSKIPPKKSQTLAVPDQRLADHIGYKVISAMGMEKAYANR